MRLNATVIWLALVIVVAVAGGYMLGHFASHDVYGQDSKSAAPAARKPVTIIRLFTGPDGLSHAEEIEMKFAGNPLNPVPEPLTLTGAAEFRRMKAGSVADWHRAPRRQIAINLSGRAEIEVSGGKKIPVEPGRVELVEDTTGKGHITRVVGNEDRVIILIPLADQSGQ